MKLFILLSLPLLIALASPAYPAGFGIYGTGGGGQVDMTRIKSNGDYSVIYSVKNAFYGGGLIFESGGDGSVGYRNRLAIGFEGIASFGGEKDYRRLMRAHLNNVFAFTVADGETVSFWIGPLIGAHLLTGHHATTRNKEWSKNRKNNYLLLLLASPPSAASYGLYYLHFDTIWERSVGVFVPIGLALGLQFRIGENARIAIEAGFRCGAYFMAKGGFNYEGYSNAGFIFGVM